MREAVELLLDLLLVPVITAIFHIFAGFFLPGLQWSGLAGLIIPVPKRTKKICLRFPANTLLFSFLGKPFYFFIFLGGGRRVGIAQP